jgi:hypothetical protein
VWLTTAPRCDERLPSQPVKVAYGPLVVLRCPFQRPDPPRPGLADGGPTGALFSQVFLVTEAIGHDGWDRESTILDLDLPGAPCNSLSET